MIDETAPQGYEKWVLDRIAKPLGMKSLTAHATALGGYIKDCNGSLKPVKEGAVDWKLPGGDGRRIFWI